MIACISIPYFAAQVARLHTSTLPRPLVLITYKNDLGVVYGADEHATQARVLPGMSLNKVHAVCPDAHIVPANPHQDQETLNEIIQRLTYFARRIEVNKRSNGQNAYIYLDLGKLRPSEAIRIGKHILNNLVSKVSVCANLGLAKDKFTGSLASIYAEPGQVNLIRLREEQNFLASKPVNLLPLTKDMRRKLPLLGIRTIGQFASLPRSAVFTQFGRSGRFAHKLAYGEDTRRVALYKPEAMETATQHFEGAINNRMVLETILCQIADELSQRLRNQQQTTQGIELTLQLENQSQITSTRILGNPIHSPRRLSMVLYRLLSECEISVGVERVEVRLKQLQALIPRQLDLFGHTTKSADIEDIVVNLIRRHGECFFTASLSEKDDANAEHRFHLNVIGGIA